MDIILHQDEESLYLSREFINNPKYKKEIGNSIYILLYILSMGDNWTLQDVAIEFYLPPSTVNRHVKKLDKLGYIEINEKEQNPTFTLKKSIPKEIRWEIWERDNFTCLFCETRRDLTIDHIIPESKGGTLNINNLQTLCRSCNSRKGIR